MQYYLEGIAFSVFGHLRNNLVAIAQLPHFPRTPGVNIAFFILVTEVVLHEEVKVVLAVIGNYLEA